MSYVAYSVEYLKDGQEESAKITSSLEQALETVNKWVSGFGGCNSQYKIFELGKEIPIKSSKIEKPQPSTVVTIYSV